MTLREMAEKEATRLADNFFELRRDPIVAGHYEDTVEVVADAIQRVSLSFARAACGKLGCDDLSITKREISEAIAAAERGE